MKKFIIPAVVLVALAGGGIYWKMNQKEPSNNSQATTSTTTAPEQTEDAQATKLAPVQAEDFAKAAQNPSAVTTPAPSDNYASISGQIEASKFQAVLLVGGETYIGKLSETKPGHWRLSNVYQYVSEGTQASLRVGSTDPLNIAASSVKQWTNLPDDHMYVEAIQNYEAAQ
jgi:hypothetical protein